MGKIQLSPKVYVSARQIIDAIYAYDRFHRIERLFISRPNKGKMGNIKIDTSTVEDTDRYLSNVFIRPESDMYERDPEQSIRTKDTRVFLDATYDIHIDGETVPCQLTTEWNADVKAPMTGARTYRSALVKVVNLYYAGIFCIKEGHGILTMTRLENVGNVEEADIVKEPTLPTLEPDEPFRLTILPESLQGAFGRRYVTALLAKPFVILTGNSGTGKTRIARRLAKVLACDVDGGTNSLVVPVGADWTDNTKLLGFFNPLAENGKGHYVKTQVLELLERAHHHPELPFFLILDEMNLSHVERYFADFLSHMEMPGSVMKLDGYGELPFPRNLFVTGTVNIDETTYMFSPKVLDRANVVEFVPEKASVLDSFEEAEEREAPLAPNIEAAVAFCKMAEDVRNGRTACQTEDVESAKQVFGAVYDVLPHGMEFAYRTVKEVRRYLAAARAIDESFDKEKCMTAIDEQLLQKVLPKIHGNKRTVGDLLARLAKLCGEQDSHSMEETGGAQFDLPKSRKKIQEMKKCLAAMQYVSFI